MKTTAYTILSLRVQPVDVKDSGRRAISVLTVDYEARTTQVVAPPETSWLHLIPWLRRLSPALVEVEHVQGVRLYLKHPGHGMESPELRYLHSSLPVAAALKDAVMRDYWDYQAAKAETERRNTEQELRTHIAEALEAVEKAS